MMKNIDQELIDWAVNKIKTEYPNDVALLLGQVGACKLPTDEKNMTFDFFIPVNERGNQMAETFIIEDMGYDLFPISWERINDIVDFKEPRMICAFDKSEVIYARSEEERNKYNDLKKKLHDNLKNKNLTFKTAIEYLNTAMDIFNKMLFEESLCNARKAVGGISCYLMNAIAMANGTYLKNGYSNLLLEMNDMKDMPKNFKDIYENLLSSSSVEYIKNQCYELIKDTRNFFLERRPSVDKLDKRIYYNDLADWYQEARYTFRKISYYAKIGAWEESFLLGYYLQIEFDFIDKEFSLKKMDLLSSFNKDNLEDFANCAKEIEDYILQVLKDNNAEVKIYKNLDEFLMR